MPGVCQGGGMLKLRFDWYISDHIRLEVSPTPRAITQVPMESVGERLFHAVDKELNKQFRLFLRLKVTEIKNLRLEINGLRLHRK